MTCYIPQLSPLIPLPLRVASPSGFRQIWACACVCVALEAGGWRRAGWGSICVWLFWQRRSYPIPPSGCFSMSSDLGLFTAWKVEAPRTNALRCLLPSSSLPAICPCVAPFSYGFLGALTLQWEEMPQMCHLNQCCSASVSIISPWLGIPSVCVSGRRTPWPKDGCDASSGSRWGQRHQEELGLGKWVEKGEKREHNLVSFSAFQVGGLGSQLATCCPISLQKKQPQKLKWHMREDLGD